MTLQALPGCLGLAVLWFAFRIYVSLTQQHKELPGPSRLEVLGKLRRQGLFTSIREWGSQRGLNSNFAIQIGWGRRVVVVRDLGTALQLVASGKLDAVRDRFENPTSRLITRTHGMVKGNTDASDMRTFVKKAVPNKLNLDAAAESLLTKLREGVKPQFAADEFAVFIGASMMQYSILLLFGFECTFEEAEACLRNEDHIFKHRSPCYPLSDCLSGGFTVRRILHYLGASWMLGPALSFLGDDPDIDALAERLGTTQGQFVASFLGRSQSGSPSLLQHIPAKDNDRSPASPRRMIAASVLSTGPLLRNALLWMLAKLSSDINLQTSLREAITQHSSEEPGVPVTALVHFIKESSRFYCTPPFGFGFQVSDETMKFFETGEQKYGLRLNDVVILDVFALNRNHGHYGEDADEFDSTRWDRSQPLQSNFGGRSDLTNGAGARPCLGTKVVDSIMYKVVYLLITEYDIVRTGDTTINPTDFLAAGQAGKHGHITPVPFGVKFTPL